MRGDGKLRLRNGVWYIHYYARGKERREAVWKILGKRRANVTEADAAAALEQRLRRRALPPKSVGGRIVGFTPADVLVSNVVRSVEWPEALIFNGPDIRSLFGHSVYGYFSGGVATYIGRSGHGLFRALAPNHHVLGKTLRQHAGIDQHLVVWTVGSEAEMVALEKRLIRELKPTANIRGVSETPVKDPDTLDELDDKSINSAL